MKRSGKTRGYLMAAFLLLSVLWSSGATRAAPSTDPVLTWNTIMVATVAPLVAPPNQLIQLRTATMMHLAVFEAVNAIVGGYEPYLGTIAAPDGASPEAAAIAAAHHILATLHPGSADSLGAARDDALVALPGGSAKTDGIAVGVAAADAMLALRADDGAMDVGLPLYTPRPEPGYWQPAPGPLETTSAVLPGFGNVTTFGIENGAQFRSVPPPAIHTGRYAQDYDEVKTLGSLHSTARSQDETDRARFYGVNLPLTVFNDAARQASVAQGKTLAENARGFALLNMAFTDALISSMEGKYYYEYWRPVTAIRAGDTDGNKHTAPDPGWLPLVTTPRYPAYPSNYASAAFAAQAMLAAVYGDDGHAITLNSVNPAVNVSLAYTAFSQMADDVYDARIHGGLHYRFDMEAGARQGRHVSSYILRNELRPLHGQE